MKLKQCVWNQAFPKGLQGPRDGSWSEKGQNLLKTIFFSIWCIRTSYQQVYFKTYNTLLSLSKMFPLSQI